MVLIINSIHHAISGAITGKKVQASVCEYSLAQIFPYLSLSADGKHWETPNSQIPVRDPRFAVMYQIAKVDWGDDLLYHRSSDTPTSDVPAGNDANTASL